MFLCKNYYIGSSLNSEFVLYHVEVKESEITLTGSLLDENLSVKSIDFSDKNGIVKVAFQAVRRGLFGKNTFKGKYRLASGKEIKEIWIDNRIIWKDGETISPQTAEVYNARNPYVGDMSANGKLVSVLQMETRLGTFSSELKTKEQPYVWKMIFQDTDELKGFDVERAKSYAYILLAEVENLSEISFEYIEQGKVHQFSVTAEDATEYAGDNIKEIGKNVNKLQKLIESTHIMDISYASENVNEKDAIQINLANQTESDITSVAMELDVDGSLAGVQSGSNADGSFVKSGEVLNFELLPEDFDTELSGKEVVTLVFTVCDKNGTWHNDVKQGSYNQFVNKISGYLEISPEFGRTYNFRLTGNEKEGYEISQ